MSRCPDWTTGVGRTEHDLKAHVPEVSFKDLDEAVVVDVKTDPEQDRVVAVVIMKVTFSEFTKELSAPSGEEIGVDRMRATFSPDRWTFGPSRGDGIGLAGDEYADDFSADARELRTFIGELPVISHGVGNTMALLSREFALAGVESLGGNRMYCTQARLARDTSEVGEPSLQEMAAALNPWRLVTSFPVDGMDKDAATVLLAACHFWAADNHMLRPFPARRRLVSDKAFKGMLNVLEWAGLAGMMVAKLLPPTIFLVLFLAFLYWQLPLPGFVVLVVIIALGGWLTLWAVRRVDEIEREESNE